MPLVRRNFLADREELLTAEDAEGSMRARGNDLPAGYRLLCAEKHAELCSAWTDEGVRPYACGGHPSCSRGERMGPPSLMCGFENAHGMRF